MNTHPILASVLVALLCASPSRADIKLPSIISNGMVLEKSAKTPVWGTADPGEEVAVTFNGQTSRAKADGNGKWKIVLNLKKAAAGPFEMKIQGKNSLMLNDILVGEVWIASGQSNMGMLLKNTKGAEEEIAGSANPQLRQYLVKRLATPVPQDDTEGSWVSASPETSGEFTAAGYYFGRMLQRELKVPVGLVNTSWGGTPSEAWTSMEAIDSVPGLKERREKLWPNLIKHPEYLKARTAYVEAMGKWIKDNKREDRPPGDVSLFAGENVPSKQWVKVEIPGTVSAAGLPDTGIVWIRKEVDVPTQSGANLPLALPIDGFDAVYWNGTQLAQTTYDRFGGKGAIRRFGKYSVPAKLVKEGKNTIAIRLYQPVGPTVFTGEPTAGTLSLSGTWLARSEFKFPPLDKKAAAAAPQAPVAILDPSHTASAIYNGMVHPILPLAVSGVIWYQGESNAGRAYQYRSSFPLLIKDWRKQWGRDDLPFYFCQLANYLAKTPEPGDSQWAELREAQSMTLSLRNTGQAVIIDTGESGDIHPRNKKAVGERLALIALAKDYGKSVVYSGPVYDSMRSEGGKIRIKFRHTDGGLVAKPLPATYDVVSLKNETAPLVRNSPDSPLEGFAICGADHKWVWADARIDGRDVVVWSDKIPAPVAVRYAWADNPTCNLANGKDLPASPFRTDDFPPVTLNGKY